MQNINTACSLLFTFSLQESRYVSLQRKSCVFNSRSDASTDQNPVWVYSCSCDQQRADIVATLSSSVNMKHEGAYRVCIYFPHTNYRF